MVPTPAQTRALCRRLAPRYDRLVDIFRLVGANQSTYRGNAVEALGVSPGETVVDLGCGTGRNFPWLERAVTASGRIVGVDLTDAMLRAARHRVEGAGWANVDLVESDAADYDFPGNVGGVLSTFAMTMFDDYDGVIRRASEALRPGGRLAILEMKRPEGWPELTVRFGSWLLRPFGDSPAYAERTPWESVRRHLTRFCTRNSTPAPSTFVSGSGICDQVGLSSELRAASNRVNSVQNDDPAFWSRFRRVGYSEQTRRRRSWHRFPPPIPVKRGPLMTSVLETTCCIVGGGPAGMMLGVLLSRAGVRAVVLEKHADFLRDFRGDTIHPSTLELMQELGVLDEFLALPHYKARHAYAQFGETRFRVADFTRLPMRCGFIAFMQQWDFLDFLARQGQCYDAFEVRMETEVTGLLEENGRVCGVRASSPKGELEIRADLVIGADGRGSTVRSHSALQLEAFGAPMDVLWFRLSRKAGDPEDPMGHFAAGRILIMISRRAHWQFGYVIPKGTFDDVRGEGIEAFRGTIAELARFAADRVQEIASWNDVKLLTVAVERLKRWHEPGLLCIGDAAHVMSPIGGVGINLAVQDAVACANRIAAPLRGGRLTDADLAAVQRRRLFPTWITQRTQVMVQNRVIKRLLAGEGSESLVPPLPVRVVSRVSVLQRIAARLVGIGVRPEHIETATSI